MRKTRTSAQHFLECDNCEEKPAKFHCKTCAGHLCQSCKSIHEERKITRNHEIVSLISYTKNMADRQHCTKHLKWKPECQCNRCRHDHSMSEDHTDLTDLSTKVKEEIETKLIPTYQSLLYSETTKKQALTKKADEIEQEIENQTKHLIEMVEEASNQRIQQLRQEEQEGHRDIDTTMKQIEENLRKLETMSEMTGPLIPVSNPIISNDLEMFRTFPTTLPQFEYILTDFCPGNKKENIKDIFGNWPNLWKKEVGLNPLSELNDYSCQCLSDPT